MIGFLAVAAAAGAQYYAGGSQPFSAEQRAVLDLHADVIALGVNSDWLAESEINADLYIAAIGELAGAVERGDIPGAVVYTDRLNSNTLPIGVGYFMTDPQKRRVDHTREFFVEDLTGPTVTVPTILALLTEGELTPETRVGEVLSALSGSPVGEATIAALLEHRTGLPPRLPETDALADRAALVEYLRSLEPDPGFVGVVRRSDADFLLVGLVAEAATGERFSSAAASGIPGLRLQEPRLGIAPEQLHLLAPGVYSDWLGRLAWGEAVEPAGLLLVPDAGHTGLVVSAEELGTYCKGLIALEAIIRPTVGSGGGPLQRAFAPVEDGATTSWMFDLGRFGPRSFGYDSPRGSSFWILPEQDAFIVYLSNAEHPGGDFVDPRPRVLPLLARALGWPGGIDTRDAGQGP